MADIFYEIIETEDGNQTTVDTVYNRQSAIRRSKKRKTLHWERGVNLYPHDYKKAGVPNVPKERVTLVWKNLIENGIFVEDEQLNMRRGPFADYKWTTVAQDDKYEVKLREDGKVYLVDINTRYK